MEFEKWTIRDPVHGMITLPKWVLPVINHPLFQRLFHVKQCGPLHLVFPGAVHTRGLHSLGTAYIAQLYADSLFPGRDDIRRLLILSALLHDIGHGPYSHDFDEAIYADLYEDTPLRGRKKDGHDQHRFKIVEAMKDVIDPIVNHTSILQVWSQVDSDSALYDSIVQGTFGADRIDFTLRDAYFCGTAQFGTIAWDRIIATAFIHDGKLCFPLKVFSDLEHALVSRDYMYNNVYFHKTSLAGSLLVRQALRGGKIHHRLAERTQNLEVFASLTDSIMMELAACDRQECSEAAKNYLLRNLPKRITDEIGSAEGEDNTFTIRLPQKKTRYEDITDVIIFDPHKETFYTFSQVLESKKHCSPESAVYKQYTS
jgi:hypothetical protein